jgi:hypothetical protein
MKLVILSLVTLSLFAGKPKDTINDATRIQWLKAQRDMIAEQPAWQKANSAFQAAAAAIQKACEAKKKTFTVNGQPSLDAEGMPVCVDIPPAPKPVEPKKEK